MQWETVGGAAIIAALGGLALRYASQTNRVSRQFLRDVGPKLDSIGEVDRLTITPLVERLVANDQFVGEPGVSYLLRAGSATLLFDSGFNPRGQAQSALVRNAESLGIDLQRLDGVVVSHLHGDHVGGFRTQLRKTFAFSAEALEPKGLPAYVPTPMTHERAEVLLTTGPRVIAEGVAVLPPLPAAMFWLGPVAEQALVVNVRGFGLVLVSGCGHPRIERMLAATERILGVPIKAVVGGLHLPVHALGTPLLLQSTLGNPNWPWRPIGERDVAEALQEISARGPRFVALSSHDSTPWTYDAFASAFGDRYRTLRVGEQLAISADGAVIGGGREQVGGA